MLTAQKISRPKSLTVMATERIRNEIINGQYAMGSALSENSLADIFGISRTPIREALMRLEREGLVEVRPQKGSFVFEVDRVEFVNLCDLRTALEIPTLNYAMERHCEELVDELRGIVDAMTKARKNNDHLSYLNKDTEFHAALYRHCGNPYLVEAHSLISGKMAALRNSLGSNPDHMRKSYEEHILILDAIVAGDSKTASRILEGHIGRKEGSYWNLLTNEPQE
ncbi:MAG: GntR family transcriptional regulator [Rhodospirillales bacterium]|nr:GntR family transcriptional regulator [Rhodospirillales bacterium]